MTADLNAVLELKTAQKGESTRPELVGRAEIVLLAETTESFELFFSWRSDTGKLFRLMEQAGFLSEK